jgi:hypothetical protein
MGDYRGAYKLGRKTFIKISCWYGLGSSVFRAVFITAMNLRCPLRLNFLSSLAMLAAEGRGGAELGSVSLFLGCVTFCDVLRNPKCMHSLNAIIGNVFPPP